MRFLKDLFNEKCPKCGSVLHTKSDLASKSIIVKLCPNLHFQKEYHPALETYIESNKVS